jgi:hypothetical protein
VQNRSRSTAVKKAIEERRPVEPWEIDELRVGNDQVLTRERFREVAARLRAAFPNGSAKYTDFIKVGAYGVDLSLALCRVSRFSMVVLWFFTQVCSEALSPEQLRLGHYLDRVVLQLQAEHGEGQAEAGGPLDLLTLLCALSLGLDCEPNERIAALHDVLVRAGRTCCDFSETGRLRDRSRCIRRIFGLIGGFARHRRSRGLGGPHEEPHDDITGEACMYEGPRRSPYPALLRMRMRRCSCLQKNWCCPTRRSGTLSKSTVWPRARTCFGRRRTSSTKGTRSKAATPCLRSRSRRRT